MKGNLHHRSLSSTTALYNHAQPSPGWPGFHQGPRWLTTVLLISSQQKQTTLLWSTVAVKLDSAFIKLCVCEKKSNFLSWAIRAVFVDPVTNRLFLLLHYILHASPSPFFEFVMLAIIGKHYLTQHFPVQSPYTNMTILFCDVRK